MEIMKIFKMEEPIAKGSLMPKTPKNQLGGSVSILGDSASEMQQKIALLEEKNRSLGKELLKYKINDAISPKGDGNSRIFQSKSVCLLDQQLEQTRKQLFERNAMLKNTVEEVQNLENRNYELQAEIQKLRQRHVKNQSGEVVETEFEKIMRAYDSFFAKILQERTELLASKKNTEAHAQNLELAFHDLLSKFERAKIIIQGFQSNEEILKEQLEEYGALISRLNHPEPNLKCKTVTNLNSAAKF